MTRPRILPTIARAVLPLVRSHAFNIGVGMVCAGFVWFCLGVQL